VKKRNDEKQCDGHVHHSTQSLERRPQKGIAISIMQTHHSTQAQVLAWRRGSCALVAAVSMFLGISPPKDIPMSLAISGQRGSSSVPALFAECGGCSLVVAVSTFLGTSPPKEIPMSLATSGQKGSSLLLLLLLGKAMPIVAATNLWRGNLSPQGAVDDLLVCFGFFSTMEIPTLLATDGHNGESSASSSAAEEKLGVVGTNKNLLMGPAWIVPAT
jgi:hypothetical protein